MSMVMAVGWRSDFSRSSSCLMKIWGKIGFAQPGNRGREFFWLDTLTFSTLMKALSGQFVVVGSAGDKIGVSLEDELGEGNVC